MAVPGDPTTLSVAAAAARQSGLQNASSVSTALMNYAADWFESVKGQLWSASTNDKLLDTTTVLLTAVGSRRLGVGLPSDFDHETALRVYDGAPEDRGTFQAATADAVQLSSGFSAAASSTLGRYIFTLAGTGRAQAQSIATYNDTTKWATLDSSWTTTPSATTTYVVANRYWDLDKHDFELGIHANGRPTRYRLIGTTTEVEPPSDVIYPLILFYGSNLTRLDENGYLFIRHLRERRPYWQQGLKVEVMAQYDDDRYGQELQRWEVMKANYGAKNISYERSGFDR